MNAFIALVRKDLVLYFSNRRSVIMSIAAPILIAAFFGSLKVHIFRLFKLPDDEK